LIVVILSVLCSTSVWGQQNEDHKLSPSDGTFCDYFGRSVSLDRDVALIGAFQDDDNGSDSGSAYVFRFDPGSGKWIEEAKLLASDGAENDEFGLSLSLSGDVALIGAHKDDDNGSNSGSAYVFRFDAGSGTWNEEAKLTASDGSGGDDFGGNLSLSDDFALIGADEVNANGSNSGAAYVFRFDAGSGTWIEDAKLLASDGAAHDLFGYSVSTFGDVALIGALQDDDNGSSSGSAYVFRFDVGSGTWIEEAKLLASDGGDWSGMGSSVSTSGEVALIGAYGNPDGTYFGSAYVFRFDAGSGTWIEEAKLLASDGADHDLFGYSVSISGDGILIGAHRDDDNGLDSGSAYVFATPATVDIKINGQDDNILVTSTETVKCTIDIVDNGQAGDLVDIWILAVLKNVTGFSFGYYGSAAWISGWNTVYFTGGLFDHSATVHDAPLPNGIGLWAVYLVVDGDSNGLLDFSEILNYDSVSFRVVP